MKFLALVILLASILVVVTGQTVGSVIIDNETPVGVVDGINPTFTLTQWVRPINSLHLFNGVRVKVGVDFTLKGNVITFLPKSIPQPGSTLVADYRH